VGIMFKLVLILVAMLLVLIIGAAAALRFIDPPGSRLMALREAEGMSIKHEWVPLGRVSPHLIETVVSHEDPHICVHWGVDWPRIRSAVNEAEDGAPEGTSTIAMQTVKNLVLWPERSYFRKVLEIPLAYVLTLALPTRRIVEIYLNIAEWGPGVFGIGAAAVHHFGKSPENLTPREAALLAAALPNPHVRNAGRPGPRTRALARRIAERVRSDPGVASCILSSERAR